MAYAEARDDPHVAAPSAHAPNGSFDGDPAGEEKAKRVGVLEEIADRAPHSGRRAQLRSVLFPRSHHKLTQLQQQCLDETTAAMLPKLPKTVPKYDWFEGIALFAIALNCVILAIEEPLDRDGVQNQVADIIDAVLTMFFVVEAGIRLACFGSVLLQADRWYVTDVFIVIGSLAALIASWTASGSDTISFSGLRAFRLLKPIRSLRAIPAARLIISALSASVLSLGDVVLLLTMLMVLFGVGGVSQYNSRLRNRCVSLDYNVPKIREWYTLSLLDWTPFGQYETMFIEDLGPLYNWSVLAPPNLTHPNASNHWGHTISDIASVCVNNTLLGSPMLFELMDDPALSNVTLPCSVFNVNVSDMNATRPAVRSLYSRCVNDSTIPATDQPTAPPTPQPTDIFNASMNITVYPEPWITDELHGIDLFARFLESMGTWASANDYASWYAEAPTLPSYHREVWRRQTCNNVDALVLKGFRCPYGYFCEDVENPVFGIYGFDNLAQALLSVFVSVTFETWFELSARMADAVDTTAQLYFLTLVLLGGLFGLNLIVAQMTATFEDSYEEEKAILQEEQAAARREAEEEEAAAEAEAREKAKQEGQGAQEAETVAIAAGTKKRMRAKSIYNRFGNWLQHKMDEDRVAYEENDSSDEDLQRHEILEKRAAKERAEQKQLAEFQKKSQEKAEGLEKGGSVERQPTAEELAAAEAAEADVTGDDAAALAAQLQATSDIQASPTLLHMQTSRGGGRNLTSIAGFIDDTSMQTTEELEAARRKSKEAEKSWSIADARRVLLEKLTSRTGQLIVCFVIFGNLVQMSLEHYGMSENFERGIHYSSLAFNIVFTIEVALRWFAFGVFGYLRRATNVIDAFVVTMSWLDFAIESFDAPIVRALRLLRFYAIFKTFDGLRMWIAVIRQTLRAATVLAVVSACALFIAACLGMQLFGGHFCDLAWTDERPDNTVAKCMNRPRANFDDFGHAMISAFQLMTGDNWDNIMVNGIRSQGFVTSLFFIIWLLLSNLVLVNLVIAIVLSARSEVLEREQRRRDEHAALKQIELDRDADYQMRKEEEENRKAHLEVQRSLFRRGDPTEAPEQQMGEVRTEDDDDAKRKALRGWFRSVVARRTMLVLVALSCFLIALESPFAAPDTTQETLLRYSDAVMSGVFILEVSLKMYAYRAWNGPNAFLKQSAWNWIDVFVVFNGFVATVVKTLLPAGFFLFPPVFVPWRIRKWFEVFRSLLPLRFVAISPSIRHVLGTLGRSIAPLRHLVIVMVVLFTFWGILGVQLFAGSFYSCSEPTILIENNCTASGNRWENAPLHFDHLGASFTALFTVITLDQWTEVMWDGIDAVGAGHGFVVNHNVSASMYFISFVVVASFFFINLFVSVLIEGYKKSKTEIRDSKGGSPYLTPTQNAWIRSHHVILNLVPQVDYDDDHTQEHKSSNALFVRFRRHVRQLVRHPLFDVVVYCFIVVNFIVLAADRHPKSNTMALVVTLANTTFTLAFALELIVRIIADTPRRFFFYKWNQFDMVIVLTSVASLVMEYLLESTTFASFFRTLRVLRLLRLLRKARSLQIVLKRFVLTLLTLRNIAALILLLFIIFGTMGVKLFGRVARDADLSRRANFSNFGNALVMLLRMCTAGDWSPVMYRCSSTPEDSDCDPNIDSCGLNVVAQLYFVIFITVGSFVILNLFVAVVLDTFTADKQQDFSFLTEWEGGQLLQLWLRFDPEFTYRMESRYFLTFLRSVPSTSILGRVSTLPQRQRFRHELVYLLSLNLMEHGGLVELQDSIFALCRRAYAFPRRKVNPNDPTFNKLFDDPADEVDEAPVENVGMNAQELEARQRALAKKNAPNELNIVEHRRLQQKADVWFRREYRDETRGHAADKFNVAHRFAVQLLEQYWRRRAKNIKRARHFRRRAEERDELFRLDEMQRKMQDAKRNAMRGAGARAGAGPQSSMIATAMMQAAASERPATVGPDANGSGSPQGGGTGARSEPTALQVVDHAVDNGAAATSAVGLTSPTTERKVMFADEAPAPAAQDTVPAAPAAGEQPPPRRAGTSPSQQPLDMAPASSATAPQHAESVEEPGAAAAVPRVRRVKAAGGGGDASPATAAPAELPRVAAAKAKLAASREFDPDHFLFAAGGPNSADGASAPESRTHIARLSEIDRPIAQLSRAQRREAEKHINEVAAAMQRVASVKDELRRLRSGLAERRRTPEELIAFGRVLKEHEDAIAEAERIRNEKLAAQQRAAEQARQTSHDAGTSSSGDGASQSQLPVDDDIDDDAFKALL